MSEPSAAPTVGRERATAVAATAVVVERVPLFREALVRLLIDEVGVGVSAQADTLDTGLTLIQTLKPDIAVLEWDAPEQRSASDQRLLRSIADSSKPVLLSTIPNELYFARDTEALGFLLKSDPIAEMARVLRGVVQGNVEFSLEVGRCFRAYENRRIVRMSRRQLEVLRCIALGFSAKRTARHLGLSPKTIDSYRTSVMAKLGIHDRVHLAHFAIREGLVPLCKPTMPSEPHAQSVVEPRAYSIG